MPSRARTGARILIDALRTHGARFVFGVPGESFISVLDALRDEDAPAFILCRRESAAAHAAEAYGKITGHPERTRNASYQQPTSAPHDMAP